ncbi:vacuolar sorting ATPase [Talaromyces pinophilus]|uniref:Vacuolar sorting ATPase n=1 Tax=Talaromyces pinophilus TaxID=128442 RepID=A0A6V8HFX8_TALPI|nr:vacuolar sorting ATPase [Talaromyces pinophilus]
MVAPSKAPAHKGKRHQLIEFIASCVPNVRVDIDGAIGIELRVVDYVAEKLQKKIATKKEKKKLEDLIKNLEVQSGGNKKKGDQTRSSEKNLESPKVYDNNKKEASSNLNGEKKEEEGEKPDSENKEGEKDAKSNGEKKDDNVKPDHHKPPNDSKLEDNDKETPKSSDDEGATEKSKSATEEDEYSRSAHDKTLNASLDETVQGFKPDTTWDMVAGLDNAKLQLQLAAELPEKQPALFQGNRKAAQFVLLYGPPGTGKGHLAKALCNSVDSTFFMVSASDITSKWIGDSERLLFKRARRERPSIIFFDEIDALCDNRESGNEHLNQMKTEFLVQMDGMNQDNSGVVVIAATNLPWKLDPAFIRRFQKRVEVNLPDESSRERVFRIEIGDTNCNLTSDDYKELAQQSAGYSGSDIKSTVQGALNCPLAQVIQATHFFVDTEGRYLPCEPTREKALEMSWRDVPRNMIKDIGVTREDVFESLRQSKSSVNPDDLEKYSEWTKKHGVSGA